MTMTKCTRCQADSDLYLCRKCRSELRFMLGQIPWLWEELTVTRSRQDRIADEVGVRIRKTNDPINAVNMGAFQLSRDLEDALQEWITRLVGDGHKWFPNAAAVPAGFIGPLRPGWRRLPRGFEGGPPQQARWLAHHVNDAAKRPDAASLYDLAVTFVGERDGSDAQRPEAGSHVGRLHQAINRKRNHFIGPCYSEIGRDFQREPIYCRNPLYRLTKQTKVKCPKCEQVVDALANAKKANAERDLQSEEGLLEAMRIKEQPISRNTLYDWLRAERMEVAGYEHQGTIVPDRIRKADVRLFSLSLAMMLRAQDEYHREQRRKAMA